MFGQQPMNGITLPPGAGSSMVPDQSQSAISGMLGSMGAGPGQVMSGETRSAIGYIDAAFEMLTAAGDEIPQIAEAIQAVKDFATQTIGMALGMGAPTPPTPMGMGLPGAQAPLAPPIGMPPFRG